MRNSIFARLTHDDLKQLEDLEVCLDRRDAWWFDSEVALIKQATDTTRILYKTLAKTLDRNNGSITARLNGRYDDHEVVILRASKLKVFWNAALKLVNKDQELTLIMDNAVPIQVLDSVLVVGFGSDDSKACATFNAKADQIRKLICRGKIRNMQGTKRRISGVRAVTLMCSKAAIKAAKIKAKEQKVTHIELGLILALDATHWLDAAPILEVPKLDVKESKPEVPKLDVKESNEKQVTVIAGMPNSVIKASSISRVNTSWTDIDCRYLESLITNAVPKLHRPHLMGRNVSTTGSYVYNDRVPILAVEIERFWAALFNACTEDESLSVLLNNVVPLYSRYGTLIIGAPKTYSKALSQIMCLDAFAVAFAGAATAYLPSTHSHRILRIEIVELDYEQDQMMQIITEARNKNILALELGFLLMHQIGTEVLTMQTRVTWPMEPVMEIHEKPVEIVVPVDFSGRKGAEQLKEKLSDEDYRKHQSDEDYRKRQSDAGKNRQKQLKEELGDAGYKTCMSNMAKSRWSTDPMNTLDAILDDELQKFIDAITYLDIGIGGDMKQELKDIVKDHTKRNIINAAMDSLHESDNES